jgi:cytochrome P450
MKHRRPPGPAVWESGRIFQRFRKDRIELFTNFAETYGDLCYYFMGPQAVCLVNDPVWIKQILVNDHRQFKKGRFLEIAKDLLGEGLLTSEGEFHTRQRRIIQPLFHRQMIRAYGETMVENTARYRERWQAGQSVDLAQEMMRLTLIIVGKTLFDSDVEGDASDVGEAMHTVLEMFNIMGNPLALLARKLNLPNPTRQRFFKAKALLDHTLDQIIAKHRSGQSQRQDLIGTLLNARDTEGDGLGMSDQQIRHEALTLFMAGHETTANALAWSWYLLAQYPRVQACLQKELKNVLGDRLPTVDDLPHLVYTRQILTEAMRLFPPAWMLGRRTINEYALGDYTLPKGCVVLMSQYLVHHSSKWYTEPEIFRPERWTQDFREQLPKFAYFPFGGGPRNCIGEAFAWMEGVLVIATLAQTWRFELEPEQEIALQPLVTLRPKFGIKMQVLPN